MTRIARAIVLSAALSLLAPQAATAADIIVRRDHGLTATERAELRADAGVKHVQMLSLPDAELVSVPDGREQQALAALNADPDVVVAAPNVQVRIASDPYASNLEQHFPRFWSTDGDVDATEAWREGWQGTGVRIAVIDQPVDADHPDLADKPVDSDHPEIPTQKVQPAPRNFVTRVGCAEPVPKDDHGTQVAGLAAAWRDNAGIAGVAPLASIVPLPAIDNCGDGNIKDVLEAFAWAGQHDIPIVVGSFVTRVRDTAAQKAYVDGLVGEYVDQYPETLFVVAAGNEGANVDEPGKAVYPCSNDAPNILCVGMTDAYDKPVCWSNVGPESVDLFAPGQFLAYGQGVPTTWNRTITFTSSGTSMAAPLVAGAAALLNERNASLTAAEVKQALIDGADEFNPYLGPSSTVPLRRLNATRPLLAEGAGRLGTGSLGGPWSTCDPDHDQVRFGDEDCPEEYGTMANGGCPDSDEDGRIDRIDNCPTVANPGWVDTDADGIGDACDPMPRGPDSDGDGLVDSGDACPNLYARTGNGCPAPPPPPPPITPPGTPGDPPPSPTPTPVPTVSPNTAPEITSLKVRVTKSKAAKVTIRLSRKAKVSLKVELKKGRRWSRVTTKSVTASMSSKSLTLRPRGKNKQLVRGSYRVTATVAGLSKVKAFRVR